jgi:Carboxypeptidase regulatory-like domain
MSIRRMSDAMRMLPWAAAGALLVSACSGSPTRPSQAIPPPPTPAAPAPVPAAPVNVTGRVVDENGVGLAGATVALRTSDPMRATGQTDASGRYAITLPATAYFWGTADKPGYETTFRDSYFLSAPATLDFRLFQPLRIVDGTSAHVTVTSDGPICGFDDEWFCRTVHIQASHDGMLNVDATSDDPSIRAAIAIRPGPDFCCEAPAPVKVGAGDDVPVYVLLWWNGPVTGVRI